KATLLIIEVRELDLQAAFRGGRALAENFEDQAGAIDYLALELFLEVALLDRRQRAVDDDQFGRVLLAGSRYALDLAMPEQRRRANLADRDHQRLGHHQPDRQRQAARLLQPRVRVLRRARAHVRHHDQRVRAA